MKMNL